MSKKLEQDKENTPVQWYTFQAKNGRDYYYEPNSKVVTWIRPRELDETETQAPLTAPASPQEESMVLERRVSFHESVQDVVQRERRDANAASDVGKRRLSLAMIVVITSVLLLTCSYFGWLPRGPLASMLFGGVAQQKQDTHPTTEQPPQPKEQNTPKKPKILPTGTRQSRTEEEIEPDYQAIEKMKGKKVAQETATASRDNAHTRGNTTGTTPNTHRHADTPKPRNTETVSENKLRRASSPARDMSSAPIHGNGKRRNRERRNRGCLVPFAHVFSKSCRKMLAEKPAYDMDALLDSLI